MIFARLGSLLALLAVLAGAFGAHALRAILPADRLSAFETAVRYQMFHALALIAVGLGRARLRPRAPTTSGWLFVAGVVLFSGSLYALAVTGVRWWGAITPLGGLSFLAGWLVLMLGWTSRPAGDDRH